MSRSITRSLPGSLLLSLVLAPHAAHAAVTVKDSPAFEVHVDGNAVAVDCSGGRVRVTIDGVASTKATACADVTSLKVFPAGQGPTRIDLSGVDRAAFPALGRTPRGGLQPASGGAVLAIITGSNGNNLLIGTDNDDTISGLGGDDTINGSGGNDLIIGGPGNDTMTGGNGDDIFTWDPGDGSDTIQGGAGVDTMVFNGSAAAEAFAVVADGTGFDLTRDLGGIVMDLESIEVLTLNALAGNDSVTVNDLTGVADLTSIGMFLADGDDTANATLQVNTAIALTIDGGIGNDTLTGSPAVDTITGGPGNDAIVGLGGVDLIDGGDGDDTITGGPGNETQQGGSGNDTFIWNPGDGSDTLVGGAGLDTMVFNGSAGDEIFAVTADGTGFDFTRNLGTIVMDAETIEVLTLNALGGNDSVTVNDLTGVADLTAIGLFLAVGDDTVNATAQANAAIGLSIDGGPGNDTLTGSPAVDTINGGDGNDTIVALGGVDVIDGGDGDDTITGGPGNETQQGGAGNDTFIWNPGDGSDTLVGGAGTDTMVFNGSAGNEQFATTAQGAGFRFTRDLGNIVMNATEVEAITLNALGGDDRVTAVGLATTSQNLVGGTQLTADVLTIDAGGACVTPSAPGTVTIAGAAPITFSEFEQSSVVNQCLVAANVPTLGPLAMAALALFLALAGLGLMRWRS